MSLIVQRAGILTTIQDLGHNGNRRFGIGPGGAMDPAAVRLINCLMGNDDSEAVVEMHFPAAQICFDAAAVFAIGGADLGAELDGKPIENWRPIYAVKDSLLRFTGKTRGHRAYLTVAGGLALNEWPESGRVGTHLKTGDKLPLKKAVKTERITAAVKVSTSILPLYSRFPTVRIIPGGEFYELDAKDRALLTEQDYAITGNSNRMGFRLAGEPIVSPSEELISSAVSFGTVQLLPDGQLIVLMADHQTTGGYPRVAHVISHDLPLLGQLGPGDKVAFHLIDLVEAEDLSLEFERELSFFRVGCRFQALSWQD